MLIHIFFTGDDVNHTVIVLSEFPLIHGFTAEMSFLVARYDLTGRRIRQMLQIQPSKLNWTKHAVSYNFNFFASL